MCVANAPTFLIETAAELRGLHLSAYAVVGVTAGASTPSAIIKEVLKTMSEEIKEKEVEATQPLLKKLWRQQMRIRPLRRQHIC